MDDNKGWILRILNRADSILSTVISTIVGTLVVLIIVLVFLQVLFRYVFQLNMQGAEELPTYFMIACVYLAAGILPKREGHIDIDMIPLLVKSEKGLLGVRILINLLILFALVFFTRFAIVNTAFNVRTGDTSPGLQFPIWYVTIVLPISGGLMTIYYTVNLVKKIREFLGWK